MVKMLFQETLRSPEILELYQIAKGSLHMVLTEGGEITAPIEFVCCGKLIEIADRVIVSVAHDGIYEQIIDSASFNKDGMKYKTFVIIL